MFSRIFVALLGAALVLLSTYASQAQDNTSAQGPAVIPVKVGLYLNPPFIMADGARYSGLAFDLFEDLARRGNLAPAYEAFATLSALLEATAAGEIDVAIGDLTITSERLAMVDFTFPWHDGGLRIMVDGDDQIELGEVFEDLGDAGHMRAFLWLAFVIVVATILLTLFDRKFDKNFTRQWFDGIVESFYHVMSIATSGKTTRRMLFGAFGRLLSAFWLVFGVAVVAYVTSSVTSVMTAASIDDGIHSIEDLDNRTVGTLAGGTSERYARSIGLSVRGFDSLNAAEASLRAEEIDAVIADATVLEYHLHHTADAGLSVVGPLFDPEKYGFATPMGSPLARALSLDLLRAHEDGTSQDLRSRYLGVAR
jgi:polar amino acid transport system substrate-binding protein